MRRLNRTTLLALALGLGSVSLSGCVQEKVNNADFKWTTNSSIPLSPKGSSYSTPTYRFSSPSSDTKYRSTSLNDVMGKGN